MKTATTSFPQQFPRRSFINGMLAAGVFSFLPQHSVFGKDAPARTGQKVRLACIGVGNQGAFDIGALHRTGLAEIVALCDTEIDGPRVGKTAGKPPNTAKSPMQRFAHVPRFQDFRKMFDKMANQIDAVLIATPDFSHFPAT
ncbi:MAG: Gfo/Idh/MocA family oxidoreductase, partial [Puniceicoccales bacterium]|nr:Gfo/Idh/MocA family oxidoreductase [Puniceicoccales bacterium]